MYGADTGATDAVSRAGEHHIFIGDAFGYVQIPYMNAP
jgi:hypothetical protein